MKNEMIERLNRLKELLEESFDCSLAASTATTPMDRLLLSLGLDGKKREQILEIIATQQQAPPELALPSSVTLPYRLQFRFLLPFEVQSLAMNQVASLLLFLNQMLDLPGFELNELEGQVIYRYIWVTQMENIDRLSLLSIIGSIMLTLALFTETIESVAEGKLSFNELLAQIVEA